MRPIGFLCCALAPAFLTSTSAFGDSGRFDGEWRTTIGVVTLVQNGDTVTGTYGNAGQFTLKGTVADGKVLTFEYQEGTAKGDARFTLDESGRAFTGGFQVRGGRGGPWNGWKPDPGAPKADPGKLTGLWLTTFGLMDLAQEGPRVKGQYALRGTSEIEGDLTGRRLDFRYRGFRGGQGWFDLSQDGSSLFGAAHGDGSPSWYGWKGRPAPEYIRHAPLVAGKTVEGSTKGLLTYSVRAPKGYRKESEKTWTAVVILHGSNMNGRSYVDTLAATWPELARDYILLGINGESPSSIGPDPRFNYSYVNYVGRSTYRGFPGTDRESPALVAEALRELKGVYPIVRYFVGGHSQGGFLTYSLLMNSPDVLAGAFPTSCGVIFQCEPSAYDDAKLKQAQRNVPLAIIHGKTDPVVDFGMGQYAADLFGEAGWPAFRFFESDSGGHMFARLPIGEAIRWLEAQASDDAKRLLEFAKQRLQKGGYRDAVAALGRARTRKLDTTEAKLAESLENQLQKVVAERGQGLREKLKAGKGDWIDEFLTFRDDFEFADGARDLMKESHDLRARHEPLAAKAFGEARAAFQQGRQEDGYAKYQEIVEKYYASPLYRTVKRWLAERKPQRAQ